MGSPRLELEGLSVRWGRQEVVRSVSFRVEEGEILSLLGPNGSGKTTLLRAIAGFEPLAGGAVRLDGEDLAGVPPHRRSVGLLAQEPALFPGRSVAENIAYAPLLQRRAEAEVRALVDRLADLLSLAPLLDRRPAQLSGGERQRVALARTLAARPRIVLLDEPFASVDVEIRAVLHAEFRAALRDFGATVVHVTHDRDEGLFLADRIALLFDGRLETVGPPAEVYGQPRTARAARFLGYNVLTAGGGTVAVLPEAIVPVPASPGDRSYRVRASGPVAGGFLSVLVAEDGSRVTVRSERPLGVASVVGLRWSGGVPVADDGR